eukprot:TRINITY_DN16986_c0_g1_i2.p1 TRINITY_DN16986_c0_g1~~TRINITY_DN16986_c0_g1_i2.p1  ORF type:complete len:757 (+),score=274.92 TRINITY_DN16986_c0_g1_i2:54-2273(+)
MAGGGQGTKRGAGDDADAPQAKKPRGGAPVAVLAGEAFGSIEELRGRITAIEQKAAAGEDLSAAEQLRLYALLMQHPDGAGKLGSGAVGMGFESEDGARSFTVRRKDGSSEKWKWGRCVSVIHKGVKPKPAEAAPAVPLKRRKAPTPEDFDGQTVVVTGAESCGAQELAEGFLTCGKLLAVVPASTESGALLVFGDAASASAARQVTSVGALEVSVSDAPAGAAAVWLAAVQRKHRDDADSYSEAAPQDLVVTNGFISVAEEKRLLETVDGLGWDKEPALQRKVQQYGHRFDYDSRGQQLDAEPQGSIPDDIQQTVVARMMSAGQQSYTLHRAPDQLIVNNYEPGQGIGPHVDRAELFDDVISVVCLGSDAVMLFRPLDKGLEPCRLLLRRRCYYTLKGKARYAYQHAVSSVLADRWEGVDLVRARRVSLTFRKVLDTAPRGGGEAAAPPPPSSPPTASPPKPSPPKFAVESWTTGLGARGHRIAGIHYPSGASVAEGLAAVEQRQDGDAVKSVRDALFVYSLMRRVHHAEAGGDITEATAGLSVRRDGSSLVCEVVRPDGERREWNLMCALRCMYGRKGQHEFRQRLSEGSEDEPQFAFAAPTSGRGDGDAKDAKEMEAAAVAAVAEPEELEDVEFAGFVQWGQTNGMTQEEQDRAMHRVAVREHAGCRAAFWREYEAGRIQGLPDKNESEQALCFAGRGSVGQGGPLSKLSVTVGGALDGGSPRWGHALRSLFVPLL